MWQHRVIAQIEKHREEDARSPRVKHQTWQLWGNFPEMIGVGRLLHLFNVSLVEIFSSKVSDSSAGAELLIRITISQGWLPKI